MSIATERLVNGLLKGFGGDLSPEQVQALLNRDVEIVAPRSRAHVRDLWPGIWALAAILERQIFGQVLIRCGLSAALPAPSRLGPRCHFVDKPQAVPLSLHVGLPATDAHPNELDGDARAGMVSSGSVLPVNLAPPTPIECFVLAGFLGFAAIARLIGIPDSKKAYTLPALQLPLDRGEFASALAQTNGFTCIGMGQIGQAYLALLYFLLDGILADRRIALIDDDSFQRENGRTQLLLEDGGDWLGKEKVAYIERILSGWGAEVLSMRERIDWTWRRGSDHPALALVGLHDLEGRRVASAAGFERLIEAGVGTNLLKPRITWHSFPGDRTIGRRLFPEPPAPVRIDDIQAAWADEMRSTPGACGWVQFLGVSATAPCLGVAAAAFALAELGSRVDVVSGAALLWSQCLPIIRNQTA